MSATDWTIFGDDASSDVYDSFIDAWHQGASLEECLEEAQSMLDSMQEVEEDIPAGYFGLALALWEVQALDEELLARVKGYIENDADKVRWDADLYPERKKELIKFLRKISKPKAAALKRKPPKTLAPLFAKGDCLAFRFADGYWGGAICVWAIEERCEFQGHNLLVTELHLPQPPVLEDFSRAKVHLREATCTLRMPEIKAGIMTMRQYQEILPAIFAVSINTSEERKRTGMGFVKVGRLEFPRECKPDYSTQGRHACDYYNLYDDEEKLWLPLNPDHPSPLKVEEFLHVEPSPLAKVFTDWCKLDNQTDPWLVVEELRRREAFIKVPSPKETWGDVVILDFLKPEIVDELQAYSCMESEMLQNRISNILNITIGDRYCPSMKAVNGMYKGVTMAKEPDIRRRNIYRGH